MAEPVIMNERKNEFFMDDKNRLSRIIEYWVDVELSSPPIIKTNNATKKSDAKWHQKIGFKKMAYNFYFSK